MTDINPHIFAVQIRHLKARHRRMMLSRGEGSVHSTESESESMGVPGEETPPSVGSKEEKVEVPCEENGKPSNISSPEDTKEKPKPRASVLEYKSVSQVYVVRV